MPCWSATVGASAVRGLVVLRRLAGDESGASHIEYALIAGLAGTLLIGAYIRLADGLDTFFRALSGMLDGVL